MKFQQLGDAIHIPEVKGRPLEGKDEIRYNYYISTRINGDKVDMDITTKIFHDEAMYVRMAFCRVKVGQIEKCVKRNLIEHMIQLGLRRKDIPRSLIYKDTSSYIRNQRSSVS